MVELNLENKPGLRRAIDNGRVNFNEPGRVNWTFVLAVVSLLFGWVASGFTDNRHTASRITALEAQRVEDSRRMERIENKIDRLIEVRK
jgi:hypothetical protein